MRKNKMIKKLGCWGHGEKWAFTHIIHNYKSIPFKDVHKSLMVGFGGSLLGSKQAYNLLVHQKDLTIVILAFVPSMGLAPLFQCMQTNTLP
jgi:hypothetical protein